MIAIHTTQPPTEPKVAETYSMQTWLLMTTLVAAGCIVPLAAADGAINQMRNATHSDNRRSSSSSNNHSGGSSSFHHDSDDGISIGGGILGLIFEAMFEVIIEDTAYVHDPDGIRAPSTGWYFSYPYQTKDDSYYFRTYTRDVRNTPKWRRNPGHQTKPDDYWYSLQSPPNKKPREAKPWALTFSADNSHDFGIKVNTTRFNLCLDLACGLSVQTSWAYLHETLAAGATDQLGLADITGVFYFITQPNFRMGVGGGGLFLLDGSNSIHGGHFRTVMDVFPAKPVVVSASLDAGGLGTASYLHTRGTVGVLFKRWEVYGGYDYLKIGPVEVHGPILGVRVWF